MYLSRIALNPARRATMRSLTLLQLLHAAVEQSFAEKGRRNLWRIDWLDNICYLLVLSEKKPDFTHIAAQYGYPQAEHPWETKDYDLLLARLKEGDYWNFRLCANPTRNSAKEKGETSKRGKVFAHVTTEQQKKWLLLRSESSGFTLKENAFDVVHTSWEKFPKGRPGKREVILRTATFEGILTISNLERFKKTLLDGIGRAKAYGCGLLTIAKYGGSYDG